MSAGAGSFIVNCNPLITSLIGYYFFKQKIKTYLWIGIIFCVLGIFVISLKDYSLQIFNVGIIYLLVAALLISFYFHLIKPLVSKYGALITFNYIMLFGSLPMLFFFIDTYKIVYESSLKTQLSILWLTIFATWIPYYTWTYSVGYFGANKASFFLYLIPVISILLDIMLYGKTPNFFTIIGGCLIIFSVSSVLYLNFKQEN